MGLIDCIKRFIDHRVDVVRRRTEYLLRKAREREHLLLGFQKALDNLDAVIETVRASKNPREAREALTGTMEFPENPALEQVLQKWAPLLSYQGVSLSRFDFSERQAQAIIELQLQRLTGMEQQKILDELAEIQRQISGYLEILGSDVKLREVIIEELKQVQKDFGDARRTQIVEDEGDILLEDLIKKEDVVVTVTRGGLPEADLARDLPPAVARREGPSRDGDAQRGCGRRRAPDGGGGKGVINMNTSKKVGNVVAVMRVKDDTDIMIISAEGKIIRIEAGKIRQVGPQFAGCHTGEDGGGRSCRRRQRGTGVRRRAEWRGERGSPGSVAVGLAGIAVW
jgi:DNA gyrase/topoisomerase IV subunit A